MALHVRKGSRRTKKEDTVGVTWIEELVQKFLILKTEDKC